MIKLFEKDNHKCVMFNDMSTAGMIQANQHVIVHNEEAVLLDPGGHKVYNKLIAEISKVVPAGRVRHIFLSHQDPDIVAALNGWLLTTDARAHLSGIWSRFVTHFGIEEMMGKRIEHLPDKGGTIELGDIVLQIIPAHYLHSSGNFHLYDPVSRILYSGDLGASIGANYDIVEDFSAHVAYMENFHKRYIPCTKALKMWLNTVRDLDIQVIAPQHGAIFDNKENVDKFMDWISKLEVGVDILGDSWEKA